MKKIFLLLSVFIFFQLSADWLIETTFLNEGDSNCPNGGTLVSFGEDPGTGVLDDTASKAYVCNGDDGCNMLVKASYVNTCTSSFSSFGLSIKTSADCGDKIIEQTPVVLCYGEGGSFLIEDVNADNGNDGNGGANGKTSELVITNEPAGNNCKNGGKKIQNSFDADGDGEIEADEISVNYVCDGESPKGEQGEQGPDGISGIPGKPGERGEQGEQGAAGEQGEQGRPGENGSDGSDGHNSLISVLEEAAGDNCKNGGKKFMNGVDADGNGVLDEAEIKNSYYICNGEDAVEASETVKESGCSLTVVDTDFVFSAKSVVSGLYDFVLNLF